MQSKMGDTTIKNNYEEVAQGARSQAALDELSSRFDIIEASLHNMWENTKASDKEAREDAWLQLNALKQLRKSFKLDIDTGKLAQKQIELEQEQDNSNK